MEKKYTKKLLYPIYIIDILLVSMSILKKNLIMFLIFNFPAFIFSIFFLFIASLDYLNMETNSDELKFLLHLAMGFLALWLIFVGLIIFD